MALASEARDVDVQRQGQDEESDRQLDSDEAERPAYRRAQILFYYIPRHLTFLYHP